MPTLIQYNDNCPFCLLSDNDETNKYVSQCGHFFHLKCYFVFLNHHRLLEPKCTGRYCCDASKIQSHNCIICNTDISIPSMTWDMYI